MADYMTLARRQPSSFSFQQAGKTVLTIKPDGTIEPGEGYTPTEAGDAAIRIMMQTLQGLFKEACEKAREEGRQEVRAEFSNRMRDDPV